MVCILSPDVFKPDGAFLTVSAKRRKLTSYKTFENISKLRSAQTKGRLSVKPFFAGAFF
jgi:hypothetical protein